MSIRHTEPQTWLFVCCSHCICRLSIFVFRKVLTPNSNHLAVKHGGISWQSHTNSTEGLRTVNVVSICSIATGIIALFVAVPYVLCVIVFILICSYNFIFVFFRLCLCAKDECGQTLASLSIGKFFSQTGWNNNLHIFSFYVQIFSSKQLPVYTPADTAAW